MEKNSRDGVLILRHNVEDMKEYPNSEKEFLLCHCFLDLEKYFVLQLRPILEEKLKVWPDHVLGLDITGINKVSQ